MPKTKKPAPPPAAEAATAPSPLLTGEPWKRAGLSRSSWYRLQSQGLTPRPVNLPNNRLRWRVADIDKWVAGLKPLPPKRRKPDSAA